jgi:hypothetical protein
MTPGQSHVRELTNNIIHKLKIFNMILKFDYNQLEGMRWIKWLGYIFIALGLGLILSNLINW